MEQTIFAVSCLSHSGQANIVMEEGPFGSLSQRQLLLPRSNAVERVQTNIRCNLRAGVLNGLRWRCPLRC